MSDLMTLPDGRTVTWRFDSTLDVPAIRLTFVGADGQLQGTDLQIPIGDNPATRLTVMGIQSIDEDRGIRVYYHEEQFIRGDDGTIYAQDFAPAFAPLPQLVSEQFHLYPQSGAVLLTMADGTMLYGTDNLFAPDPDTFVPELIFPTSFLTRIFPYAQDIARLDDGGVVWATMSRNAPFSDTPVQIHIFDADLGRVMTEIDVGSGLHRANTGDFASAIEAVSVDVLADGRIALAWTSERYADESRSGTPENGVFLSVLTADGTVSIPETAVAPAGAQVQEKPQIYALENGGFALAWQNRQQGNAAFNADIVVQTYDATGALVEEQSISRAAGAPAQGFDTEDLVISPDGTSFFVGLTETIALADRMLPPTPDAPSAGDDLLVGTAGSDVIDGLAGNDTIEGRDGADTLIGGDGDDLILGGETESDLRDVVYAGAGDDSVDGGHGNDELYGMGGNDTMEGGFGVDRLIGGDGDDVLNGGAFSDQIFGGDGFDFINGGFGSDRLNGGAGADRFFHVGSAGHGSDWIQDYNAAEGDVLLYGGGPATARDFLVQIANTAGAGEAGVNEAFVTHIPSGNLLWALVDGDGQTSINIQLGGQVFDLLA